MREKTIKKDSAYLFQHVMDIPDDSFDSMQREKKRADDVNHYRALITERYSLPDNARNVINDGEPIIMDNPYNGLRLWR